MSIEDIIKRRVAATGEDYQVARATVQARLEEMLRDALAQPEGWVESWTAPAPMPATTGEGAEWIRARPAHVLEMMRRFPPSCVVRAREGVSLLVPLCIDGERRPGIVVGHAFDDRRPGLVRLTVSNGPRSGYTAQVDAQDLEVLGYRKGQSPEWLAAVLEAVTP